VKKIKIEEYLQEVFEIGVKAFIQGVLWMAIFGLLYLMGYWLDNNFGPDSVFIPIILGCFWLVYITFYTITKNSLKDKKSFKEINNIMSANFKKNLNIFLKGSFKLFKILLFSILIIGLLWWVGGLVAGLSATTVIIILLILVLFK